MAKPFLPGDTFFVNIKQVHTMSGQIEIYINYSNDLVVAGDKATSFLKNLVFSVAHFTAIAAEDDAVLESTIDLLKNHLDDLTRKLYADKKGKESTPPPTSPPPPLSCVN